MQNGFEFPESWRPGRGLSIGPVGIWKYHYPAEGQHSIYIYCGLCFKPVDENDEGLYGYTRYVRDAANDLNPQVIGDGSYAFACIDAMADECRFIPEFTESQW